MAQEVGIHRTIQEAALEFEAQTGIPVLPSQRMKQAINHQASKVTPMEKFCWLVISNTYLIFTGLIILFRGKAPKEWIAMGLEFSKRAVYRRLEIQEVVKSGKQADNKEKKRPIHKNVAVTID